MRILFKLNPTGVVLLLAAVVVLIALFWQTVLLLLSIGALILLLLFLFQYIRNYLECKHCDGRGVLCGHNEYLKTTFHQETCYFCAGQGVVSKDRKIWLQVIQKADQMLNKLRKDRDQLKAKILRYRKQMKLSNNTDQNIVQHYHALLEKGEQQIFLIEEREKVHTLIKRQAHINAHNIHLLNLSKQQQLELEEWDLAQTEELNEDVFCLKDMSLKQQYEYVPPLEILDSEHMELVSDNMRVKVEAAMEEYQLLFNSR
ncbi:MAG: hypothetical protein AAF806_21325 [Bacteroidota bacterium]